MENVIERINELEKKSKIGKADSLEVTKLIYQVYCSNKDYEILVNYLYDFNYKISGIFAGKYYLEINKEERNQIVQYFVKSERFSETQNLSLAFRGFAILTELICKDIKDNNIFIIINRLAKLAENSCMFNQTSCGIFLNFLNETNGKIFDLDFSSLEDHEIKRLFRYTSATITDISIIPYGNKIKGWAAKYSFGLPKETTVTNVKPIEESSSTDKSWKVVETPKAKVEVTSKAKSNEFDSAKELISTLKVANQEAQKLFDNIFNKNITIQTMQEKLNAKEKEIYLLKVEIENKNISILSLNDEINKTKEKSLNTEIKLIDLTERLKASFNADDVSKKQELITLKTDIATSVKLQYEDFNEHKNEICNEDNYEALKVTLNQVFRTLKKYGIEL
ncbi:MAG: hypothetical protein ACREVX_02370 [Clostridium sp.]|uniref:hypothetical protein n=1 Tax=Clostridium sp. TaxID=1506 RepID=UPI003D6CB4CE